MNPARPTHTSGFDSSAHSRVENKDSFNSLIAYCRARHESFLRRSVHGRTASFWTIWAFHLGYCLFQAVLTELREIEAQILGFLDDSARAKTQKKA
jgi:hypothetical protein